LRGELGKSYYEGVAMKNYKRPWEVAIECLEDLRYRDVITNEEKWGIVELLQAIPEGCKHEKDGIRQVQQLDPEGFAAMLTKYKLLGVLRDE